jgi:RNA methyltransferase, TrmH family
MSSEKEIVTSRANPLFKRLRAQREHGDEDGLCLLEGPRLVEEALAAGIELVEAVVSPRALARAQCGTLVALLGSHGVPVRRLHDDLVASLSEAETSQGLLAFARRPAFEEDRIFDGVPLVVLAVGIQDPGNLGGLLRTAEAAGASGAYLADGCADPLSWKGLRGSMGSAFRLPHVRALAAAEVLDRLDARGIPVLATAAGADTRYDEADLVSPVALVFGAEGSGVPAAVAQRARLRLRVPIATSVESLNVSVAAGLLLFEAARQRGFPAATRSR